MDKMLHHTTLTEQDKKAKLDRIHKEQMQRKLSVQKQRELEFVTATSLEKVTSKINRATMKSLQERQRR